MESIKSNLPCCPQSSNQLLTLHRRWKSCHKINLDLMIYVGAMNEALRFWGFVLEFPSWDLVIYFVHVTNEAMRFWNLLWNSHLGACSYWGTFQWFLWQMSDGLEITWKILGTHIWQIPKMVLSYQFVCASHPTNGSYSAASRSWCYRNKIYGWGLIRVPSIQLLSHTAAVIQLLRSQQHNGKPL
jgi:hypothetical protein